MSALMEAMPPEAMAGMSAPMMDSMPPGGGHERPMMDMPQLRCMSADDGYDAARSDGTVLL